MAGLMQRTVLAILLFGLVLASGCGSARRSEPLGNAPELSNASELRGRKVFMANCNACHEGGAGGLGPALNNKPLPGWLIRFQVRNGLGVMPAFPEKQISNAELDDLLIYLKVLRQADESQDQ